MKDSGKQSPVRLAEQLLEGHTAPMRGTKNQKTIAPISRLCLLRTSKKSRMNFDTKFKGRRKQKKRYANAGGQKPEEDSERAEEYFVEC